MELDALQGANKTIERSRPILLVEKIKSNPEQISRWFSDRGYLLREVGINILAVHSDDKVRAEIIPAPPRNDNWRIGPAQIQISLHCVSTPWNQMTPMTVASRDKRRVESVSVHL